MEMDRIEGMETVEEAESKEILTLTLTQQEN